MINKLLVVIFVLIFVILAGEGVYLFFVLPRNNNGVVDLVPTAKTSLAVAEIGAEDKKTVKNINELIKRRVIKTSRLINEYEVRITGIKTGDIKSPYPLSYGYAPVFFISVQKDSFDTATDVGFFFDTEELAELTVIPVASPEKKLNHKDLRVGQLIKLKEIYDFARKKTTGYEIIILAGS